MSILSFLLGEKKKSASVAKERLQLIIAHERAGGHAPNVLNASNEVAVEAFLNNRLGFTGIPDLIEYCLEAAPSAGLPAAAVVAWTLRPTAEGLRWMRWQSPPLVTQDQWQQAWQLAANWAQDGTREVDAAAVAVLPLASWTLAYFRNNTWTQPVGAAALGLNTPLPDGVRLVLDLPPGAGLIGQVSRDWVRPTFTVQRGS